MLVEAEEGLIAGMRDHRQIKNVVLTVSSLPKMPSTEELLGRYAADAPALYVVPGNFQVTDDAIVMVFTVVGVVRNVAGHEQARKGDGIAIGCDGLMLLATRALHDKTLGGTTWRLVGGEMVDDDLFDESGLAAVELRFQAAPVLIPGDLQEDEMDDFLRFHADVDIRPHASNAEHGKWLQHPPNYTESQPDAQANLSLPGANA